MKAESPVYRGVDYSPEAQDVCADKLYAMFDSGVLFGAVETVEPDSLMTACMLGVIGEPWYSQQKEASELVLYVTPGHRGRYVADRLVSLFEQQAKALGAVRIHVGSSAGIMDERVADMYRMRGYTSRGVCLSKDAASV